jgi:excisionase family DNA binding protein
MLWLPPSSSCHWRYWSCPRTPIRESPPPPKRYYRMEEVAFYFGISARTVYRLLDDGDLHVTRIRGCVRVSAEELRRFEERLGDETLY